MKRLRTGDWVVVADGDQAMFLENTGDTETPALALRSRDSQQNAPDRDQATDRPGRRMDNSLGQRSAMEETDFHQQAKDRFAAKVAKAIGARARRGAFARLVLVAPPAVLGEIRRGLDEDARRCILAEIAKDLTNHPLPEIGSLVKRELEAAD